jgi:hypothetical protein
MHETTNRNLLEWKSVPNFYLSILPGAKDISDFQSVGGEDIPFLTVEIMKQSYARCAIRVIFNSGNLCIDVALVPFEVDDTVPTLMPPAAVARCDVTVIVSTAGLFQRLEKSLLRLAFRNLLKRGN